MALRSRIIRSILAVFMALFAPQLFAQTFNYGEALQKSLFFYEAQRSGDLPADQPRQLARRLGHAGRRGRRPRPDGRLVRRRRSRQVRPADGGVAPRCSPGASSTTASAYVSTGQLDTALDQLKWATDYFIKAHPTANELYGQIGTGGTDHAWWGPAEVMQMARPSFTITQHLPGIGPRR